MATRHKKPNKRSIAAKRRWAKAKIIKTEWAIDPIKTPRKGYSSPSDIVARMNEKDEFNNSWQVKVMEALAKPSAQTRLDIIFHDLEQAMKDVITKLKVMF